MTPEELTFITLQEPAPIIDTQGNKFWYNEKGRLHRDNDLPAVVHRNGRILWFKNGDLHRENGKPAVTWPDGSEEYWEYGRFIR